MHFFILGSLEVKSPEKRIQITAPKQRAVLAALLLGANSEVPIDQLIRFVWDNRPPATAQTTLQSYIYRLRQLLRPLPGVGLKTDIDSYMLDVGQTDTDLWFFRGQVEDARKKAQVGQLSESVSSLRGALSVWRGNSLSGIPGETVQQEARVLDGERIAAYEELFATEILLGNTRQIIPELHKVVSVYQFHEAFRAQLMLALYASGRQAEALQNYALIRRRLRDRLGIEPGQDLQELHRSILEQVPAAQMALPTWGQRARVPVS
ncbi:BTAD domain-containing putative transcriptional regulator [Plantactinospora solaniradicis]|uniref:BTAD domain-containing putative transcriptional regulator n=1 Tax=Plantactinospora solaniradicis TaxID=1723736 RepID=A0ABW1K4M3_9ACTN